MGGRDAGKEKGGANRSESNRSNSNGSNSKEGSRLKFKNSKGQPLKFGI
jgi:hypothetical protein